MGFVDWLKQPFLWGRDAFLAFRGGSGFWQKHPLILLSLVTFASGFAGGIASRMPLPSFSLPVIPSPSPAPSPAPIPAKGLHVLMVVDSSATSKLPAAQQLALTSGDVREYLNQHCPLGPDGHTPEWRLWDKTTDAANESPLWQAALKRTEGKPMPWIIVSNPDKGGGYEGQLPANAADLLALLKKYGG